MDRDSLAEAVISGAGPDRLVTEPVPAAYLAAHIRIADTEMFAGVAERRGMGAEVRTA